MDHEVGPWKVVVFHGQTSFHEPIYWNKSIYKAFGALTRCKPNVDQEECTKSECIDFFNICQHEKNSSLTILSSYLGLHFLLYVSKMWLANLLTTIFTKKTWQFDLYIVHCSFVHVQCNLHVTFTVCCTSSIICNLLHHVYSNSWVLDVLHCLVKHVRADLKGRARK